MGNERNMKISLITLQSVRNYGSVLQAFATQSLFESIGFDVEIVNYFKSKPANSNIAKGWAKRINKPLILTRMVMAPTINKWNRVFDTFLQNNLYLTPDVYISNKDFLTHPIQADAYCVGSDQVWNSDWNRGFLGPLFLNYAPDSAYKFAFSSSFGKAVLSDTEKPQIKHHLERFDRISVREQQAVSILEDLGIQDVQHVLDPTLCMTKEFWNTLVGKRPIKQPYLLVYQLNSNKEFDQYAQKLAKKMNLKLVRICTRYDQIVKPGKSVIIPEVNDYVSLFYYADFVLTDSFHGTGFSINFNKQFCSVYPEKFSSRISSILKLTGLSNRHLKSFEDFTEPLKRIDYAYANNILDVERDKAQQYLTQVKSDLTISKEISR